MNSGEKPKNPFLVPPLGPNVRRPSDTRSPGLPRARPLGGDLGEPLNQLRQKRGPTGSSLSHWYRGKI